ncbi:MAG: thioredoxin-disulfide reductase, partial [Phototrophicales bacterium]
SKIIADLQKQAYHFGVQFLSDSVISFDATQWPYLIRTEQDKKIRALSVIVATGAAPRRLGVPGEQYYWGRGVSSCALCDAPFYKDEEVIVVGGGDSAVEQALLLASRAKMVTIVVRKNHMRAATSMKEHLKKYDNIAIKYNTTVTEITGDDTSVTGVILCDSVSG